MIEAPYFPIVYLRGYAGSQGEVEDTVSTPYMGFNPGSTRIRQLYTEETRPHVFESSVVRPMKDHGYVDAYQDGQTLPGGPIPSRSIWTFRYYDIADEELGRGERREIEFHTRKPRDFLLHVRGSVLDTDEDVEHFRVYLVAHSMGGLICRCHLQYPNIQDLEGNSSEDWRKKGVDKLFTYGTPHGGIEFPRGLGWADGLRDFFDPNNAGNFGTKRMREFLGLPEDLPLNSLNGRYPTERVFCFIGTDSRDYGAAGGLAKRAVGPLSDGLVRITNASVHGAPRAVVHRNHAGYHGLVNSESGYRNLRHFLFGGTRVLVEMADVKVSLRTRIDAEKRRGKRVLASYHVDTVLSVRGVPIELNRCTYAEGSAIFRQYERLIRSRTKLFTALLMRDARINPGRRSLGSSLRSEIRVSEYEADGCLIDGHYEGGVFFPDKLNIEVTPFVDGTSRIRSGCDTLIPNRISHSLEIKQTEGGLNGIVPFGRRDRRPGIRGNICMTTTLWNTSDLIKAEVSHDG